MTITRRLPPQSTPFIGRQAELAEISAMLTNSGCRLLSLTGPGGIGKTRLAVQAAADSVAKFSDSVYFVPVVSTNSPDLLVPTIAAALGVPMRSQEDPKGQLLDFLREKHLLLVIDNFEHLLEGAGLLAEFLDVSPGLKVLVTSRERLNLQEEWVLQVRGLDIVDYGTVGASVEQSSAVQLFVQAARRADASFRLTEADIPFVARICQIVEGMPLAIELSASWVRVLSCQEILQEIERNLGFLSTPLRNVPERHQSMRAVFEHSWRLLSADEKAALRSFAVFSGGFTRDAAEQVARVSVFMLGTLVDKSVLGRNAAGRYDMHELLRQYIAEHLEKHPQEQEAVLDRHAQCYTDFLRQRWEHLHGPRQKEVLEQIEAEIDNVRAAWLRATRAKKMEQVEIALDPLWYFYDLHLWFREGESVFKSAAEALRTVQADEGTQTVLARVLARLAWFCRSPEQREAYLDESVEILRQANAPRELAFVRLAQAFDMLRKGMGGRAKAKGYLQDSLALYQRVGDRWFTALCLDRLGTVATAEADYTEAERCHRESLAISEELGDRRGISRNLHDLAEIVMYRGRYADARPLLQKSLAVFNELGDRFSVLTTLNNLGNVAIILGDYLEAKQNYEASLVMSRELPGGWIAFLHTHLSRTYTALGEYETARQYYQTGLAHAQEENESFARAWCQIAGGHLALALGDSREAQQCFKESARDLLTEPNAPRSLAYSHAYLGAARAAAQDYAGATQLLQHSLSVFRELGDQWGIAYCLECLGKTQCALGQYPEARQWLREALKITVEIQALPLTLDVLTGIGRLLVEDGGAQAALELLVVVIQHPAGWQSTKDEARQFYATLAVEFTPNALKGVQERAQKMSLDEIIRELTATDPQQPFWQGEGSSARRERSKDRLRLWSLSTKAGLIEPLSERELEVLRLMDAGLSNNEIAQELVVALGTVKAHARNIYEKLNARSRTEATARARELNLL